MTASPAPLPPRHSEAPPYLTGDVPPVGGRIRERPEDFLVDEQPLYAPSGAGEHIYLFIEKRNVSTVSTVRRLARHFRVRTGDVGYAGLKDKRAVTRQVFSVWAPGKKLEDFPSLDDSRLTVLWADYHANKLRRGHLAGNRFSIRIRGIEPTRVLDARRVLDRLMAAGVPNRIGEQRFGYTGRNHLVGRGMVMGDWKAAADALLAPAPGIEDRQVGAREAYTRGDYAAALSLLSEDARTERAVLKALKNGATPERAMRRIEEPERGFFHTAFQSAVFNIVLDRRVREGTLGRVGLGDVAFKHDNRAVFVVTDDTLAEPGLADRAARFEISPSGPMWGPEMVRAGSEVDRVEVEALGAWGVRPEDLAAAEARGISLPGERRPLRVPLTFPEVEGGMDEHGPFVRVAFDLPRGAFATSVLREIMKPELSGCGGGEVTVEDEGG